MKPDIKFEFEYDGLNIGVEEFDFYNGTLGSFYDPPEDPEIIIKQAYSENYNKDWELIPESVLGWLLGNLDFYDAALSACIDKKAELEAEKEEDEADE